MYSSDDLHFGNVSDSKTEDEDMNSYEEGNWFYLDHSCNEWVIGTKEDVLRLISDLQKIIKDSPHER